MEQRVFVYKVGKKPATYDFAVARSQARRLANEEGVPIPILRRREGEGWDAAAIADTVFPNYEEAKP